MDLRCAVHKRGEGMCVRINEHPDMPSLTMGEIAELTIHPKTPSPRWPLM